MNFNNHSRSITDFPNYKVSSDGKVYNSELSELKQTVNKRGYTMVKLCKNGFQKNCSVHRLVAEAFIPNEENKPEVNHIDGNKLNNTIDNLEWVSRGENQRHAYSIGLRRSYLTNEDRKKGTLLGVEKNRKNVRVEETGKIYKSIRDCARDTGCDVGAISKCCNGFAKKHHGLHFTFVNEEDI